MDGPFLYILVDLAYSVPVQAGAGWYNGLGFLLSTAHGQFWNFCKSNAA
mgnify:CR=1 FL=1